MRDGMWAPGFLLLLVTACASESEGDTTAGDGTGSEGSTATGGSTASSASSGVDASTGTDTTADEAGDASSGDEGGGPGCAGASLRSNPEDPAARGPWTVGARTATLGGLTVEVWYPAPPGSERGIDPIVYDVREQLPASEQDKISDADNPPQPCDCYRDLPVDDAYGPYPAIVFVHGTASFRTQSLPQMVHWASRGFVVLAADHPGLRLRDMLGMFCGAGDVPQDLDTDIATLLSAIRGDIAGLEDFAGVLDVERIGMAGHSAGGNAVGPRGDDARVIVPLAAGGTDPGTMLTSTLVMGGTDDSVVAYTQQQNGFASSPAPKRLVGIEGAGHLSFSEICSLHNRAGQNLLDIATDNGVCGAQLAGFLFQCSPELIADPDAWEIVDFATAATFEETLHCSDIGAAFADITTRFPAVAEFAQR